MRGETFRFTLIVLMAIPAGCRLPGMEGPVSRSLATSRQLSQQGVAAGEQGQWDRAEELLAQAVRASPSNADARRAYAEALWNRGHRTRALDQLAEARKLAPRDAGLWVRAAEMHLALAHTEQAKHAAERALDLDPKLPAAWAVRARSHRAANNTVQALADYHRALSYQPGDRAVQWELAELYRQLGQPQRALAALQTLADAYSPGDEPQAVLYAEGMALLELGRADDAADMLAAAANQGQASPDLLHQLAQAQWEAGRGTAALATVERSLALDPAYRPSRELLDRIQLARQTGGVVQR